MLEVLAVIVIVGLVVLEVRYQWAKSFRPRLSEAEQMTVDALLDQFERVLDKIEDELVYHYDDYPEQEKRLDTLLGKAERSLAEHYSLVPQIQSEMARLMTDLGPLDFESHWHKDEIDPVIVQLEQIVAKLP